MNIIDERDVRTIHRKLKKKEYDEIITLSTDSDDYVRLLDEGMVVRADGTPDFYIMKGTLQKYMDALPDDYEGSINLGHMNFATFPILLGSWRKSDFRLVDIGGGRKGLDVKLNLDEENILVKELRRAKYELGVSAEFTYGYNEELSEDYGLLMVDTIFIKDFAIVGDAGNVNSMGIQLKGDSMDFKKVLSLLGEDADLNKVNDILDKLAEEKELEATEEVSDETEEVAEEPEKELDASEEETEEETEEVSEETPEGEVELSEEPEEEKISLEAIMDEVKGLTERITKLEAEKADIEAEKKALEEKLSAKEQSEAEFVQKFKKLSVALSTERTEPVVEHNEVSFTDGFGG